ncbi:hypothetical protein L914_14895 [Phytophthora nicotianae]|uniref:Uncharacterized protein n=1 Tax=Phytophthora nicotianae TaxID=4792 RepID=W2MRA3_PHYNI|nr:hypothetical protein L914_14895 [Phytophthora nicotianae]
MERRQDDGTRQAMVYVLQKELLGITSAKLLW